MHRRLAWSPVNGGKGGLVADADDVERRSVAGRHIASLVENNLENRVFLPSLFISTGQFCHDWMHMEPLRIAQNRSSL